MLVLHCVGSTASSKVICRQGTANNVGKVGILGSFVLDAADNKRKKTVPTGNPLFAVVFVTMSSHMEPLKKGFHEEDKE